jgi:hypothetical protein
VAVGHAAGESSPGNLPANTHLVILAAEDEPSLAALAARLDARGAGPVRIHEDRAPYLGQLMAVGLPPGRKEVIGRHVRGLPLLPP